MITELLRNGNEGFDITYFLFRVHKLIEAMPVVVCPFFWLGNGIPFSI